MLIAKSIVLFVVAGLFEIGGGYLVWQCWALPSEQTLLANSICEKALDSVPQYRV